MDNLQEALSKLDVVGTRAWEVMFNAQYVFGYIHLISGVAMILLSICGYIFARRKYNPEKDIYDNEITTTIILISILIAFLAICIIIKGILILNIPEYYAIRDLVK